MSRRLVLRLTMEQAKAMLFALGNSTDAPDVMESLFQSSAQRAAAWRAARKLSDAIRSGPEPDHGGRDARLQDRVEQARKMAYDLNPGPVGDDGRCEWFDAVDHGLDALLMFYGKKPRCQGSDDVGASEGPGRGRPGRGTSPR